MARDDTLPKLLKRNYEMYSERRIAMRRKDYGIWNEYTWKDCYENVKGFSLGLISLGLKPGDKIGMLGENDAELYWAIWASQAARATPVGMYPDNISAEVKYTVDHCDATFVVVEDQEQVDKILEIREEIPKVKKVIFWDPKGMYTYTDPFIIDFCDVVKLGRDYEKSYPGLFEHNIEQGGPDDIACFIYTSGTTGIPKGVMWNNRFMMRQSDFWLDRWQAGDEYLSYLCPAWGMEWVLGLGQALKVGAVVNFSEKPETMQDNIREIAPCVLFYGARMWESLSSTIQAKISDTSRVYRLAYNMALPVGYKIIDARRRKERLDIFWQLLYKLADLAVFRALRDKHGLTSIRWAYTAGAGVSPDILRFFQAIGVRLKQTYGIVEAGMNTLHQDGNIKIETVGEPLPTVEIRISDEEEVLVRCEATVSGYYKDPELTSKMFDRERWYRSGDAGYLDEDGQLTIVDRVINLMELSQGHKFAPDFIETRLRFSQYIKDAMAIGGRERPYITVVIIIDYDNVGKWAESHHLAYTTFADLSQKKEVSDLILNDIQRVNAALPGYAKIKKYALLHKEFDPDEAELTRTRKLRRGFMEEKYANLLQTLYTDSNAVEVEARVTYRDGRKGVTKTTINIRSLNEEVTV